MKRRRMIEKVMDRNANKPRKDCNYTNINILRIDKECVICETVYELKVGVC